VNPAKPIPTLAYQTPGGAWRPPPRQVPILEAILHVGFGIVLPPICFAMAFGGYPALDRPWKSGELRMYAGLIPRGSCAWPFYPLLLYSMASLVIAVIAPTRAFASFPVRLGVYSGAILALQFSIIQLICLQGAPGLLGVFIGVPILMGFYEGLRWILRRFARELRLIYLSGVLLLFGAAALLSISGQWRLLFIPGMFCLVFAPMLALATYLTISRLVWSNAEGGSRVWLWLMWTGSYGVAWWLSIAAVLDEYSRLPKAAPKGCYIATAAAGGHTWLVRSTLVACVDGSIKAINPQLLRLKCGELVLARVCPMAHGILRRFYDRVGPLLARGIEHHPLLCDIAYCALKPLEWLVVAVVWLFARTSGLRWFGWLK
jgi:hypothetical protein